MLNTSPFISFSVAVVKNDGQYPVAYVFTWSIVPRLVAGMLNDVVATSPWPGPPTDAPDRQAVSLPLVMVTVVTASRSVVSVPLAVSAGLKVMVPAVLHATGNTGDVAPANKLGVDRTRKLVIGKATAATPNRIFRCILMVPPRVPPVALIGASGSTLLVGAAHFTGRRLARSAGFRHSTTTERSTSPRCIRPKASSTASSAMRSDTNRSRSSRP